MNGFRRKATAVSVSAALLALALPVRAEAHLMTTGLGPVYDGVVHLLASPEDLIPTLLVAVLAGMNGPTAGRYGLFLLPAAWMSSAAVASYYGPVTAAHHAPSVTIVSLVLPGLMIALDRRVSPGIIVVLALLIGATHGALNGIGLLAGARERTAIVGIGITAFVVMALVAAAVVSFRAPWTRIALRVAGSWSVAIGLLLLGWTLRNTAV